jgi:hypothetical protein
MEKKITENLSLNVSQSYSGHWSVWLYNDATGLSLQVGDAYYTSKHKAVKALYEAYGFLKHSLQLNEQAA